MSIFLIKKALILDNYLVLVDVCDDAGCACASPLALSGHFAER